MKEDLKLLVSTETIRRLLCEAKQLAGGLRERPLLKKQHKTTTCGYQRTQTEPTGLKSNGATFCEWMMVLFGSRCHRQSIRCSKNWIQTTVHYEDSGAWQSKHHDVGIFLPLFIKYKGSLIRLNTSKFWKRMLKRNDFNHKHTSKQLGREKTPDSSMHRDSSFTILKLLLNVEIWIWNLK